MNQRRNVADTVFMGALFVCAGAVVLGLMIAVIRSLPGLPTVSEAPPPSKPIITPPKPQRDWGVFGKDAGKGVGKFARGIVTGAIEGVLGTEEKKEEPAEPEADTESTKS